MNKILGALVGKQWKSKKAKRQRNRLQNTKTMSSLMKMKDQTEIRKKDEADEEDKAISISSENGQSDESIA